MVLRENLVFFPVAITLQNIRAGARIPPSQGHPDDQPTESFIILTTDLFNTASGLSVLKVFRRNNLKRKGSNFMKD